MAFPPTPPTRWGTPNRDPGLMVRRWAAMLLRVGVGLSLLSSGLAGYFGAQRGGGGSNPFGPTFSFNVFDPFFTALPYIAIGLGLALILGFLTTPASIAAGFFTLLMPLFQVVQIVSVGVGGGVNPGFGRWGGDPFVAMMMSMTLPNLVPMVALIWLSPLENHPFSIDALIFGRDEIEPAPTPDPIPSPAPVAEEGPIQIGE